jgi:hypothetical protein
MGPTLQDFPRLAAVWSNVAPTGTVDDWEALERMLKATADDCEHGRLSGRDVVLRAKRGNLQATMSELRIAALMVNRGHRVRMLTDSDPSFPSSRRPGVSLPDLHVHPNNGTPFMVEVRRRDAGDTDFTGKLQKQIDSRGVPYRVCPDPLDVSLSTPGTDFESRKRADDLANEVLEKLLGELERYYRCGKSSGIVIVSSDDGCEHRFEFELAPKDDLGNRTGFVGSFYTYFRTVDEEIHAKHFIEQLRFKLQQREKIAAEAASIPYVVAFDNWCIDLEPRTIATALIGPPNESWSRYRGTRTFEQRALTSICERGWSALIAPWKAIPSRAGSQIRPHSSAAVLVTERWTRKLSGVLVNHECLLVQQWLPNPFAFEEVCSARLLDIGFDLDPEPEPYYRNQNSIKD